MFCSSSASDFSVKWNKLENKLIWNDFKLTKSNTKQDSAHDLPLDSFLLSATILSQYESMYMTRVLKNFQPGLITSSILRIDSGLIFLQRLGSSRTSTLAGFCAALKPLEKSTTTSKAKPKSALWNPTVTWKKWYLSRSLLSQDQKKLLMLKWEALSKRSVIFPTTVFRQKSPDNLALLLSLNLQILFCGIKLCNLILSSKFLFNWGEIQSFCRKISPIFHFWQNFGGICFGLNFQRKQKIGSAHALPLYV